MAFRKTEKQIFDFWTKLSSFGLLLSIGHSKEGCVFSEENDKALNSGIYKQSVRLADFQSIDEIR